MPDNAPTNDTAPTTEAETATTDADTQDTETVDWKAEAEAWKARARKQEDRAKANANAARELEDVRRQSMTDTEKAVADAKAEGRLEAIREVGAQLVAAELRAQLVPRGFDDERLAVLAQGLNVAAFLKDDGSVDTESVGNFVAGLAPANAEQQQPRNAAFPDLGQGARPVEAMALNGDPILNAVKSKLGIG